MNRLIWIIALTFLSHGAYASCKYYAYVSYGPAMYDGKLNQTQKSFKSSGLKKYKKGFRAVYTSYGQTTLASGFAIENIGPYDTEAVAYDALKSFIDTLKSDGYVKKSHRHTFPAVILRNKKTCG